MRRARGQSCDKASVCLWTLILGVSGEARDRSVGVSLSVDIPGSDNMSFTLLVVSVGVCLHGWCDVCKCNRSDSYACTEQ